MLSRIKMAGMMEASLRVMYTYLCLYKLHPLVARFDNGTRNINERIDCNLIEDIINGNVSACASHTSTAVDQNRTFRWLVLGLNPTMEPKNGRGILRHTVIRPGSEME